MGTLKKRKETSYQIFNEISKSYDFLNHLLSFGIDILWRKKYIKLLPDKDSLFVLDLATGTGDVPITLSSCEKIQKIQGLDMSEGMLEIAQKKIEKKKLNKKIKLLKGDAVTIPYEDESFDVITLSFGIRNFPDPQTSLKNMYRVLRPKGRVMIMEFSIPKNFIFKQIYLFYFKYFLPFIGNLVSGHKDAYTYLNKTVEDFPYGEDFIAMMEKKDLNL